MDLTRLLMLRLQGAPIDMPIANGKDSPAPPPAPDPRVQIEAEAKAKPSVYSPFGNTVYSGSPNDGSYRADVTLSPREEALYRGRSDIAQALLGRSAEGIKGLPVGYQFNGADDPTTNRFFTNQKKLLDTTFDRDETRERQRLANQGIPEGSEAYTAAMDDFSRRKSDAYDTAAANALTTGFNQDIATRQQNYNEIAAALGGSQLTPVTGGGGGVDTSGAFANQQAGLNRSYQGALAGYQGDVGTTNTALVGGATVAAAFI